MVLETRSPLGRIAMRYASQWKVLLAATAAAVVAAGMMSPNPAAAQRKEAAAKKAAAKPKPTWVRPEDLPWPPKLPNGADIVTDTSADFLKPPETLRDGVTVAKTAPTVDFMFYQNQNYVGKPWS